MKYIVVMFTPEYGCSYKIVESSSEKSALLQVLDLDYDDENITSEDLMERFCDWTDGHILVEKLCLE